MMEARDIPQAIVWHEGMLLAPHHFQQATLRHDALLHYHTRAISPFHWGIHYLKLDRILLVSGLLRVMELQAVMPDGLVVHHDEEDAEHLEINLKPYAEEMRQKPLTVHLAIAAQKFGFKTFKGDLERYQSLEGKPVLDEMTGDNELIISRLRPKLVLLATENPPPKYISFPVAQVTYKNEKFDLTDFLPPALTVPLQYALGQMCAMVARRIREKAVYLAEQARTPASGGGTPMILETKSMISNLVSALSYYEAIINTGLSHPYHVYLAMCLLTGNLAGLGAGLVPPALEPYDHNNLRATFDQVINFIYRMLEEGIQENYSAYPFHYDANVFSIKFEKAWMDRAVFLGVRGQSGMPDREVADWTMKSWIGSASKIPSMREKRILGAGRIKIEREQDIVPAKGVSLFSLQPDPEFVLPGETLQIFNATETAAAPRPAEILLYVKKAAEKK